jgi:23S rRNA (cytidine1920-2'-O)/16S rRNA (cytidine1409-2'-O)-methyltransferase
MTNIDKSNTTYSSRKLVYPMRLDMAMVERRITPSRTRADEYIRAGSVSVNGTVAQKPAFLVRANDVVDTKNTNPYVSRAALKIVGANKKFKIDFASKVVLDVGSSTGGFTQYALKMGARKVIAVDVGTDQMHPSVSADKRVELHEKTDIRDVLAERSGGCAKLEGDVVVLSDKIDIIVCDVSFISLRYVVPHLLKLMSPNTVALLMCKPQFEAGKENINKGVVKNESIRRKILADFETYLKSICVVLDKIDSDTPGEKGNVERFFLVKKSR